MFDFKIKRLDKVKFNIDELVEYYYTLERDFQHLKWKPWMIINPDQLEVANWYVGGNCNELDWGGWCIQKTQDNTTDEIECPWRVGKSPSASENASVTNRSAVAFGIIEKFLDTFPDVAQMALVIHPPGAHLVMHSDNSPEDIDNQVIQVPILTNDRAYWIDRDGIKTVLQPGYAYLVDTWYDHGTINEGNTPRIHIKFSVNKKHVEWLINTGFDIT